MNEKFQINRLPSRQHIFKKKEDISYQKLQEEVNKILSVTPNKYLKDEISKFGEDVKNPSNNKIIDTINQYRASENNFNKFEYAFKLYYVYKFYEENIPNFTSTYKNTIFNDEIIAKFEGLRIEKGFHYKTRLSVFRIYHLFNFLESKGYYGIYKNFKITPREILMIHKLNWKIFATENKFYDSYQEDLAAWDYRKQNADNLGSFSKKREINDNGSDSDQTIIDDEVCFFISYYF